METLFPRVTACNSGILKLSVAAAQRIRCRRWPRTDRRVLACRPVQRGLQVL